MRKYSADVEPKKYPDVFGCIELTRHYYSHPNVVMEYAVTAYYTGDEDDRFTVTTEYKNTIFHFWGQNAHKQEPPMGQELGPTGSIHKNNRFFPDSGSIPNSLEGGADPNNRYSCEAYIRMVVSDGRLGDEHYHFKPTHSFQLGVGAVE